MPSSHEIAVTFTDQQLGLIDRHVDARPELADRSSLICAALAAATPEQSHDDAARCHAADIPRQRPVLEEATLQPGTGKAFEVRRGQIVRVSQTTGGQCADFNAYNLHNRHEHLHVGRTRSLHGNNPTTGDFVWSNAPWERPMFAILNDTGQTDTEFPSCSAQLYWRFYGERAHTNCQQMQTEAQREYGLRPDEVHESLNLFMYCAYDDPDAPQVRPNLATEDDFIELLALQDVLAVFNTCGDDFDHTNNYAFKPLTVTILASDAADRELADRFATADHSRLLLQSPYDEQPSPLARDPRYAPDFPHAPVISHTIAILLTDDEREQLDRVARTDLYGDDLGAALREIVVSWTTSQPRVPDLVETEAPGMTRPALSDPVGW